MGRKLLILTQHSVQLYVAPNDSDWLLCLDPDGSTQPIPPGQSAELLLDLPAGTYTMNSTLLSGAALGETGTLHVG